MGSVHHLSADGGDVSVLDVGATVDACHPARGAAIRVSAAERQPCSALLFPRPLADGAMQNPRVLTVYWHREY